MGRGVVPSSREHWLGRSDGITQECEKEETSVSEMPDTQINEVRESTGGDFNEIKFNIQKKDTELYSYLIRKLNKTTTTTK